jgi:hypothetical protein
MQGGKETGCQAQRDGCLFRALGSVMDTGRKWPSRLRDFKAGRKKPGRIEIPLRYYFKDIV